MQSKSNHGKSKSGPKRGGNRRTGSPDMIDAAQRQTEALRLRQQGKTFAEIAQALGYSDPSGARNAVMAALREATTEPNNEMRALELTRLDALHAALWPLALAGELGATDRILKIMERRAKIMGLDAPSDTSEKELDELIAKEFARIAGLETSHSATKTTVAEEAPTESAQIQ